MPLRNLPDPIGYLIGYARVSTVEQRLDLQIDAIERAGVKRDDIFVEKVSGASRKRPALDLCFKALRSGDMLIVWRLDRLGRSLIDLLRRMQQLEERGIKFRSLTENIDTSTATGRLLMHMVGAMAEFERQLTRERTKAGVKARQDRGGAHGRPVTIDLKTAEKLLRQGKTISEAARAIGCTRAALGHHYKTKDAKRLARLGPVKKSK